MRLQTHIGIRLFLLLYYNIIITAVIHSGIDIYAVKIVKKKFIIFAASLCLRMNPELFREAEKRR